MPRQSLFTILCVIAGFAIGALGGLVVIAQCMEWLSFGNWNPVSVQYGLNYFAVHTPHFGSTATGIWKIVNGLEHGLLELPLSIVLLGIGGLIAATGAWHAQQRARRACQK